jgi:hypothetical protein
MDSQFSIGRIFMAIAAVALMYYGYQYAMSQAIHTIIASQPPAPKLMPAPSFNFDNCDLGLTSGLYGADRGGQYRPPCRFDPPTPPKAEPIVTMTKADSKKASLWFLLATFALPLALGAAALAGFWVVKAAAGRSDDDEPLSID